MKKILVIIAAIFIMLWAFMFFVFKTGEIAHIMLAIAGIIILFLYSMKKVLV